MSPLLVRILSGSVYAVAGNGIFRSVNLGATISMRVMENKTFTTAQTNLEYKGISRTGLCTL